jgi:hypothetical protein
MAAVSPAGGPDAAAQIDALLTPAGAALLGAAAEALAGGAELAVGARLRAAGHPAGLVAAAFAQAELRRRAASRFSRAEAMLFTRAGLEQASSEAVARHRAARFAGLGRLADLCTGLGGDLLALAADHPVLAVDRDRLHLRLARHNAGVYLTAADIEPVRADVRDVDLPGIDGAFVDPARRADGRRFAAGTSEPPLSWCVGLTERVAAVAVKAAPGIPVELAPPGWEVEFVADRRGLKEAVLFSPALATAPRRATVLPPGGHADRPAPATLVGQPDQTGTAGSGGEGGAAAGRLSVGEPGRYLYDPNPAVTRAGLVGELGRRLDAWQVDPRIAFLTADEVRSTPFARPLRIEASLPFDVRRVAAVLRRAGVGSLDVRRRGLAGDVEAIRRRVLPPRRDLVPGGPAVTVVMTRLRAAPWAFVCTDVA